MALDTEDKVELRQKMAKGEHPNWTKADINAINDILDDWYETSGRPDAVAAINSIPESSLFTSAQKKKIGGLFLIKKGSKELS